MAGIFKRFFKAGTEHGINLINDSDYREYCYLMTLYDRFPRFTEKSLRAGTMDLIVPDMPSFLSTYRELFVDKIYNFQTTNKQPIIIDIGANIGLSILFFKKIYPNAQITGYEADPYIFTFLKNNLEQNGVNDVVLENKAIWIDNVQLDFFSEKADGGRISKVTESNKTVRIEAVDIRDELNKYSEIDFLKIDIEGAEHQVIPKCNGLLEKVKHIFVEYHSFPNERQNLDEILHILIDAGFTINIQSIDTPKSPYIHHHDKNHFNMQLNIFGKRD